MIPGPAVSVLIICVQCQTHWTAFQNTVPTLPTMQFSHQVTSLGSIRLSAEPENGGIGGESTDVVAVLFSRFPRQHVRRKLPQLTGRSRRSPRRWQAAGNAPADPNGAWHHRVQAPPAGHQGVYQLSCGERTATPAAQHQALHDVKPQQHARSPSGKRT